MKLSLANVCESRSVMSWLLNDDCPVLVAAGRLAPWKGFDDLIRAMKDYPEPPSPIDNSGRRADPRRLETLIHDNGLERR